MEKRIDGASLRQIGTLFNLGAVREATDGQLLERSSAAHGETAELAFAALVERLYEEVIAEYGDVPYLTTRDRMLEGLLRQPEPEWNGAPLTDEGRGRIEAGIARRRSTLGQVAEARLDDWFHLAVGNPAPEIEGVDLREALGTWLDRLVEELVAEREAAGD